MVKWFLRRTWKIWFPLNWILHIHKFPNIVLRVWNVDLKFILHTAKKNIKYLLEGTGNWNMKTFAILKAIFLLNIVTIECIISRIGKSFLSIKVKSLCCKIFCSWGAIFYVLYVKMFVFVDKKIWIYQEIGSIYFYITEKAF